MKFEIFSGNRGDERIVRLAFKELADGDVSVCCVDDRGKIIDQGYLVTFKRNGTLALHTSISKQLGFSLDGNGVLKTEVDS